MDDESVVRDVLSRAWRCEVRAFAHNDRLDFWCERDGQMAAVGEIKVRSHAHDAFETTWLRLTKWLELQWFWQLLDLAAFYVVEFTDGLYYVHIADLKVPPCRLEIGGRSDRPDRGDWDRFQAMVGIPCHLLTPIAREQAVA